jgi:hypothetical protein
MVCAKCNGTGWYQYDHNHSKVCEVCCKHDKGFWELEEHYGEDNGKLCCLNGCGFTKDKEVELTNGEDQKEKVHE